MKFFCGIQQMVLVLDRCALVLENRVRKPLDKRFAVGPRQRRLMLR